MKQIGADNRFLTWIQILAICIISPSFSKEENMVTKMWEGVEFKNVKISNLSDNFLFIFSVHLVGLVNFGSRKY